ncbi:CHAT domain-containing protein [Herbidospora mongoliensis]|uniref:CHAT domain-containing protein n=1 Tax=Herbidospora mongoliensis TaxID=688067 RepID=UPI000B3200EF|nr:CHAT domain-containing protein [Herbidospora mongoliensis]
MPGGRSPFRGIPGDLLPLVFARPADALAGARALLDGRPTRSEASIAHQVIGIWERDFGRLTAALKHLRKAVSLADSADREADVLATLGAALVHAGHTRRGLAALERAVALSEGGTAARVLFRRAYVRWVVGDHEGSLSDVRRALPVLRRENDVIWTARALTLRATVHLAVGAADRAGADFTAADELWARTTQDHDKAKAVENRGLVAWRAGDAPAALRHFDEAAHLYETLGTPAVMLTIQRCGVLLSAGLARDALDEAQAALTGQATRAAELRLVAARAAVAAGDPGLAVGHATAAARVFARQRRGWWHTHARLVLLHARYAAGDHTARDAPALADRLAELRSPEAAQARLLAGRIALARGNLSAARLQLGAAAEARRRGPAQARADGWTALALFAAATGDRRLTLDACRKGLDVLDEHRMTLGAAELRARATVQGAELATLAQRAATSPRELLRWSDRWRATALAVPPARPPADPELSRDLTAFREIGSRAEAARAAGSPQPALDREQRRLERRIRAHTLRLRGTFNGDRLDVAALLTALGDDRLVAIVPVDGMLHAIVCGGGRVRRFPAGSAADAALEAERLRAALRRLAHRGSADWLPIVAAGARRLETVLFGRALGHLGDGQVTVVPPGRLHGVPWAALPSLRDRAVGTSPSAGAWLRARRITPPGGDVVLVRGPGLVSGGAEVPLLARDYGAATVLADGAATAGAVLAALDGSRLAHIAAHGTFRDDSPMFSALRMDDGPLTVHDVEGLRAAPYRMILSSCEGGRLAPAGADELLGLAAALLPLGTAGLVASVVPVNDAAVVPFMVALHDGLRAGLTCAEALRDARRSADPATGWSFSAIGAS